LAETRDEDVDGRVKHGHDVLGMIATKETAFLTGGLARVPRALGLRKLPS